MAHIELTETQIKAVVDALNSGVIEAIAELQRQCPEIGDYFARQILLAYFRSALQFDGKAITVDVEKIREQ